MTDKDDQQWLDALAGRQDASADPITNAQAQAIRTAMIVRRAELELSSENTDSPEFYRLKERLQREGFLAADDSGKKPVTWLVTFLGKLLPHGVGGSSAIPFWSLAANVVLGAVVVVQMGLWGTTANPDADVLRGGTSTMLLVPNPEARLAELTAGLDQANARFVVLRRASGELKLLVQADGAALDYLLSQRIAPKVSDGLALIVLRK